MDKFENVFKVHFGPDITSRLSLEFGLMDIGEVSFDDPDAVFTDSDGAPLDIPAFKNAHHGDVVQTASTDTEDAYATYTGFSSAHPQSFIITFRYRIPVTDGLDFFLKTGANIWWADYELVEITAFEDVTISRRTAKKGQTSAVDQISGGGFLWSMTDSLSLRAELETSALDSIDFERARFQLVTVGVQYQY